MCILKRMLLLCYIFIPGSLSCASNLPERRPDDFSVSASDGAGMIQSWWEMFLSEKECRFERVYHKSVIEFTFTMTAEELDALYDVFVQNRFDDIETYQKEVLDRGGSSISIRAGSQSYSVMNSGFSFIESSWRTQYETILRHLTDIQKREVDKRSEPFTIVLDESLSGSIVIVNWNQDVVFNGLVELDQTETLVVRQIPTSAYECVVYRENGAIHGTIVVDTTQTKSLHVSLSNNAIVFERP